MDDEALKAVIAAHTPPRRRRTESQLIARVERRAEQLGLQLYRNQVGTYHLPDGRWIRSGLCVGSSDLIGWMSVVITPAHLGRTLAVFVGVEAKGEKGRLAPAQQAFLQTVTQAGGVSGVVRSVDDFETLVAPSGCSPIDFYKIL